MSETYAKVDFEVANFPDEGRVGLRFTAGEQEFSFTIPIEDAMAWAKHLNQVLQEFALVDVEGQA